MWTDDPRLADEGMLSGVPFDLFDRQRELVQFLFARMESKEDGVVEKSRDMGFSVIAGSVASWFWLFRPGHKTTYSSYLDRYVDLIGNPDSWFEKVRILLRRLPEWMMPEGWNPQRHDNSMRLLNPANGNVISGEVGAQIGRGGRSTLYVLDECAFMEYPDNVDASTHANTKCRIFASTVNGLGNLLARKRHSPETRPDQIFRLHWSDDPRKTTEDPGWEARERKRLPAWKFASEFDIDYTSSVEGVFIPAAWVQACIDLPKHPAFKAPPRSTIGVAGLDVGGGGSGKSVKVVRYGPWVTSVVSWGDPDTIETAMRALRECEADKFVREDGWDCTVRALNYDCVGIGDAVLRTLTRCPSDQVATSGVNTGVPASERMWEDGQTSLEKFGNLKAELTAIVRERAKCSYEMLLYLQGKPGGQEHPGDELLLLPCATGDDQTLIAQMSYPKRLFNEKGKIVVESKKDLAKRGLPSPDHLDALVLTEAQAELNVWARLGAAA